MLSTAMTAQRGPGELEGSLGNVSGSSNTSGSDVDDDPMTMEEQIGYVVLMSACIGVTVVGNILVILSVFTYRPLRNVQNFYIVSLACADLAVALIVMPFNVVTFVLDGNWIFGEVFCNVWLTSDILTCTASILNLCGIAVDRYCAIHDPIAYSQRRTVSRVMVNLAVIWLVSAVISVPPLIGWNNRAGESLYDDERQICKLTDDRGFVIYSASGSFYIPLCLMSFVYVKIFLATRARLRARACAAATLSLTVHGGAPGSVYGSDQTDWNPASAMGPPNGNPDTSRKEMEERKPEVLRVGEYDEFRCDGEQLEQVEEGGRNQNETVATETETKPTSLIDSVDDATALSNGLINSPNGRKAFILNDKETVEETPHFVTNRVSSLRGFPLNSSKTQTSQKQHTLAIPPNSPLLDPAQGSSPLLTRTSKSQSLNERVSTGFKLRHMEARHSSNNADNHRPVKQKRTLGDRFKCAISPPEASSRAEDHGSFRKGPRSTGSQKRESSRNLKISITSRSDRGKPKPVSRTSSSSDTTTRSPSQYLTAPWSPADPSPLLTRAKPSLHQTNSNDESRFKFSVAMRRFSRDSRKPGLDGSQRKDFWSEKQRISLAKERRVARTMAIIMAAFVVCWLPFFLMYVIFPFCQICAETVDQRLVNFIVWLGYVNSTLNPIIYTIFNIDFRRAFVALLRGKRCPANSTGCSSTNVSRR